MKLLDKVCELWGRTLSPIETQKIINLAEEFSEEVILEAAMISSDKTHPMQYMCKCLYYVKHPTEQGKKKPVEEKKKIIRKCKWLEEFLENLEDEDNQGETSETGSKWLDKFQEKNNLGGM